MNKKPFDRFEKGDLVRYNHKYRQLNYRGIPEFKFTEDCKIYEIVQVYESFHRRFYKLSDGYMVFEEMIKLV